MNKKVVAKFDFTIPHFNIRTPKGSKARKDYLVGKGEKFNVIERFLDHNMATYGNPVLALEDPRGNGYQLLEEERYFDYLDE